MSLMQDLENEIRKVDSVIRFPSIELTLEVAQSFPSFTDLSTWFSISDSIMAAYSSKFGHVLQSQGPLSGDEICSQCIRCTAQERKNTPRMEQEMMMDNELTVGEDWRVACAIDY